MNPHKTPCNKDPLLSPAHATILLSICPIPRFLELDVLWAFGIRCNIRFQAQTLAVGGEFHSQFPDWFSNRFLDKIYANSWDFAVIERENWYKTALSLGENPWAKKEGYL